jgi:hypothetical protein
MRECVYVVPTGISSVGHPMVFLNMKDAYLPAPWQSEENKYAMWGGGVDPEDRDEAGTYPKTTAYRELTEETGNWWTTFRTGDQRLEFLTENVSATHHIHLFTLKVDVSEKSFKHLQKTCTEGIPVAMTYRCFLTKSESDFCPGVYRAVRMVFDRIISRM